MKMRRAFPGRISGSRSTGCLRGLSGVAPGLITVDVFSPDGTPGWLGHHRTGGATFALCAMGWNAFLAARPTALVQVLVLPDLRRGGGLAALGELERRGHVTPTVLATRPAAFTAEVARFSCVHDVLWSDDVGTELAGTVRKLLGRSFLHVLPGRLRRLTGGDAEAHTALAFVERMCGPLPLPKGVEEAALELDVSYTTLLRRWRETFSRSRLRPKSFGDLTVLARALELRRALSNWEVVANAIGCHVQTLERTFRRWTGGAPGGFRHVPPFQVTRRIVEGLTGR